MTDLRTRILALAAALALLAIGIVLGSGPLRSALLGQTGDRIATLEAELAQAEDATAAAAARADRAAAFVAGTAPAALDGLLQGRTVLVVVAPGAGDDAAAQISDSVALAGGTSAGPVSLGEAWDEDDSAAFRAALVDQVEPTLVGVTDTDPTEVLAHAFVQGATGAAPTGSDLGEVDAGGAGRGAVLWDLLNQAGLAQGERVDAVGNLGPDAIVIIAGDEDSTATLVRAFASYDAPVTVAGSPADTAPAAARTDVATVASSQWEMGAVATVATVAQTLLGAFPDLADGDIPESLSALGAPATSSD